MLAIYDYLEEILSERRHPRPALRFYASEITEQIGGVSPSDMAEALRRAMGVCAAAGLPVADHFRGVYRFDGQNLIADFLLSSAGCYLLILNGNPFNPLVAKAQLSFSTFSSRAFAG